MIRRGTEEGAEHVDDFRSLKGGSLGEGGEDGDVLRAGHAAGSHADFSKDDERAQSAFGMVVGGKLGVSNCLRKQEKIEDFLRCGWRGG